MDIMGILDLKFWTVNYLHNRYFRLSIIYLADISNF